MLKRYAFAALALAASTAPALAHLDPAHHGSFMAGLSHPLFGLDHVLAMLAVGLWAAMIGGRALWIVPAAFVGTMTAGYGLSLFAVPLPFVEPVILASVVALGLLVAAAVKLPAAVGAVLVGLFALFHGHAHGGELGSATALTFGLGFIASTALLHGLGVGLGMLVGGRNSVATRILGALTAVGGAWLAFG
jgi:urease accessory protein